MSLYEILAPGWNAPLSEEIGRTLVERLEHGDVIVLPHLAMDISVGQYRFEQTCLPPVAARAEPERAPLKMLERLAGKPLA